MIQLFTKLLDEDSVEANTIDDADSGSNRLVVLPLSTDITRKTASFLREHCRARKGCAS